MNPRPLPARVIAALHLPPFPASGQTDALPVPQIREYALRNAARAVRAGIRALYIQDLGDRPVAPSVQPHTVAGMAVIGAELRREFPELVLGICLMSHGAREPLAAAQAAGASFVRLKVYVGAMVKAEGLVQGCAYEAQQYRRQIGAEEIAIYADVYDRTGEPLGRLPLVEEARQAAVFGRADGLVLTGKSLPETFEMVAQVRQAGLGAPLLIGGGVGTGEIAQALEAADGVIASTAFKADGGWTQSGLLSEWDEEKIRAFVQAAEER